MGLLNNNAFLLLPVLHILDNVMNTVIAIPTESAEALKGLFHLILPLGFVSQPLIPPAQANPNSKHT